MNKRGILGIDTVKAVILALLVMAVFVVVTFLVTTTLRTSVESIDRSQTARVINETVGPVDEAGVTLGKAGYRQVSCTVQLAINATGGKPIAAGNYTSTGCNIAFPLGATEEAVADYNASNWKVTYSYVYAANYSNALTEYVLVGPGRFFTNVPTFFSLLGVVVLILLISIIIVAVTRFRQEGTIENL